MHSYEDRMRAVSLSIKLGKRAQATIRELGYPTKNTLRCWHREYERSQDLPIGSAPRLNRPGFTGGQNSRRIARYGTCTKEEDFEAVFTCYPAGRVYMPERASSANARFGWRWNTAMSIKAKLQR